MLTPEEMKRVREENLKLLKEELPGKVVTIKSNLYYDRKVRRYKVVEVEDEYVMSGTRPIHGLRLVNDDFKKEEQPFFKYPTSKIIKEDEGDKWKLSLSYTHEVNIARDFRHLHKRTQPDLVIYIYYEKEEACK